MICSIVWKSVKPRFYNISSNFTFAREDYAAKAQYNQLCHVYLPLKWFVDPLQACGTMVFSSNIGCNNSFSQVCPGDFSYCECHVYFSFLSSKHGNNSSWPWQGFLLVLLDRYSSSILCIIVLLYPSTVIQDVTFSIRRGMVEP